jgi:membrane associated rhomboid family serine protease
MWRFIEKHFQWLAIPNIAILLVTLQGLGSLLVLSDPAWIARLALIPELVLAGEYWRLITFLALPLSLSPLWIFMVLWFLYFILNSIEQVWGALKTTLYVLISVLLTIAVSFAFHYPVTQVSDFESTLFIAAATLFPEQEVRLFFAIPVKMKWLAFLSGAFVIYKFLGADWVGRIYLLAIYSNYLMFFGPEMLARIKNEVRRQNFKRRLR